MSVSFSEVSRPLVGVFRTAESEREYRPIIGVLATTSEIDGKHEARAITMEDLIETDKPRRGTLANVFESASVYGECVDTRAHLAEFLKDRREKAEEREAKQAAQREKGYLGNLLEHMTESEGTNG